MFLCKGGIIMKQYCDKKNCCNNQNSKFNFNQKKENTLCSLYQVENFLCQFSKALKCFKFYEFFK